MKPKRDPAVDAQIAEQNARAAEQKDVAARETTAQKQSDIQAGVEAQAGLAGGRASRGRRSLISSALGGIGYYSRFK
tara:strand:- start:842 stop:1072 length:231 start_codon:yes stop_codon:yes gene_type:complete